MKKNNPPKKPKKTPAVDADIAELNKQLMEANKLLAKKESQQRILNKKLEKFNASKAQFFANVSHELRAPLTLILGIMEGLLLDHKLTSHQSSLKVVERNARQVLNLVNDLVDVARLEAGKGSIKYFKIDLAKLVKQTAALFESYASERQITLTIKVPRTLIAEIDFDKIQRVLLNLLSNAFKFTPVQGEVSCSLMNFDNNTARLVIADSGPGISPKMRETIFERFFYVEAEENRKFSSIGLGLAMVKDFVELHGGNISLSDDPHGGAIFIIDLPMFAPSGSVIHSEYEFDTVYNNEMLPFFAPETTKEKTLETTKYAKNINSEFPLVLVVEDNIDVNQYIVDILRGNFRTESAYDGAEALQKVLELHPDIIITDILMPRMDGFQLINKIREHESAREIPIIVISAKIDEELCVKLLSAGAQDYLAKPFARAELKARVNNLVNLKRAQDELQKKNIELTVANRELDAFGYSVSHDLRSPLHAVIGFSSILLDENKLDKESTEYLRNILLASKRMEELINDLLALSYAIRRELIYETVNLSNMVTDIVTNLKEQEPERKAKIHIKPNVVAECDSHLVKIALENLLRNAWKYTSKNPETEIEFGLIDLPEPIYYIRDNGVGFDIEKADKLFLPFSRLHSEKDFPGTGIGLAIVKRIVERHGGRISVESEEGKGTIFYMTLAAEKGKIGKNK